LKESILQDAEYGTAADNCQQSGTASDGKEI
jgi:hypothetical protein